MTVTVEAPETPYVPTGASVGPFSTIWSYADASDVVVVVETAGVEGAALALGDDFTVVATPLESGGYSGAVTLSAGVVPAGGWAGSGLARRLILRRRTGDSQNEPFGQVDGFRPQVSERAWDRDTRRGQEYRAGLGRALKVPVGAAPLVWPDLIDAPGKVVGFDANGKLALFSSASQVALADNVTWLRVELGAVARTIAAKVADTISVLDFIPVSLHAAIQAGTCDVDLAEWIQAAIDCRPHYDQFLTRGIRVLFPAGTYPTSTLDMGGRHGVHLDGDGMFAAELRAFGTDPVIQGVGSAEAPISKASIKGFTIRGGGKANANAHGISLSWTNRCAIEDVIFYGCRNGLDLYHNWQLTLINVHADGAGADQNYIGTYMGPSTLANIDNAVIASGLTMQGCQYAGFRLVNFNGSKFTSCEAPGGDYGWYLGDPPTGTTKITWGHFVNCLADTNNLVGWYLKKGAATAFEQVQFANCWCGNSGGENWLIDGCDGVVIACPEVITSQKEGMKLIGSTRCIISNPIVRRYNGLGGGYAAIHLVDSQFCVVDGGNTETVFAGGGVPYGVKESGTSDNNRIAGGLHNGGYLLIGASTYLDEDTRAEKGGITGAISYSRTEAGAVSRFVGDRLRDEMSVLDFIPVNLHAGIKAKSYFGNLWAYIQAAINAAGARGCDLFWPAGHYYIHAGLAVPFQYVSFRGAGRGSVHLNPVGDFGDVIVVSPPAGSPNCQLFSMTNMNMYAQSDTTSGALLRLDRCSNFLVHGCVLQAHYGGIDIVGSGHGNISDTDIQSDANFAAFRAGSYLCRIRKGIGGEIPAEIHLQNTDWRGQSNNKRLDYAVLIQCCDGIWFDGPHFGFAKGAALALVPEDDTATLVSVNVNNGYMDTMSEYGIYIGEPSASYSGQFGAHHIQLTYAYNCGENAVYWNNGSANTAWSTLDISGTSRIGKDAIKLVQGSKVTIRQGLHLSEFGYTTAGCYGINVGAAFSDFNIGEGVIEKGGSSNTPAAGIIIASGATNLTVDRMRIRNCTATITDNSGAVNKVVTAALAY